MNYYVVNIRVRGEAQGVDYNEKASRQGVAVDRALTKFLKRYQRDGRNAPTGLVLEILVSRS